MPDTLTLIQLAIAAFFLFCSAWLLVQPRGLPGPQLTTLSGAAGLALVGYLLCEIGLNLSLRPDDFIRFENASDGFAIALLGVLPWALSQYPLSKASPYLIAHGSFAVALLAFNALGSMPLRFSDLALVVNPTRSPVAQPSLHWVLYIALALSAAGYCLLRRKPLQLAGATRLSLGCVATAIAILGAVAAEATIAAITQAYPPAIEWIALSAATALVFALRFSHRDDDAERGATTAPPLTAAMRAALQESHATPALPQAQTPALPAASQTEDETEDGDPSRTRQSLLYALAPDDATLISKLLDSMGHRVMLEPEPISIPIDYFADDSVSHVVFFERDITPEIPQHIRQIERDSHERLAIIAISRNSSSDLSRAEIEQGLYDATLERPIKALALAEVLKTVARKRALKNPH